MAVSYVTQANANSASSQVTSKTITIPTVVAGDVLLLVANCYSGGSGSSTINISSTGTAWTRQGSSTYVAGTSSQNNGSLFYLTAGASETGKVVTISTATALYYNITMVVYRGAALPFDGVQIASSATLTTSDTCPTITTTNSGTWLVCLGSLCNGSAGFSSCTGPSLASTVREANFGSASGIAVASDSNGSVSAGSQVPGHFTPSSTADYITWSAGIAPASTGTSVNAGAAAGTGTAQQPTGTPAITGTAGLATATAAAALAAAPAVSVTAGLAAGTGTAQAPSPASGVTAGLVTATGTARGIGSSFSLTAAGLATGTAGAARVATAVPGVTAGLAHGTGTAQNASVSTAGNVDVSAGFAHGTGTARSIGQSAGITAGYATGTAAGAVSVRVDFQSIPGAAVPGTFIPSGIDIRYALIPGAGVTAGLATGTGTARAPAPGPGASAGPAIAAGTAQPPAAAPGVKAALVTGTGTAQNIGQSASITAGFAHGSSTALPPGQSASITAGLAHGTGTAFNGVISSVVSPVLTGSGFGTFPQVPAGAVVLSVVAAIVQHGSNAGIGVPSYELWDGTSARIGAVQFGTASTAAAHTDSVVFTGVSYSQLATLQLRMYATSQSGNSGATVSVDAVSLSVSWAAGVSATVAPSVLVVVPVIPAPSASGVVNATATPDVLITVPAFPAVSAGFAAAAIFPGVLTVVPAVRAAAAAAGVTLTPGVLTIVPAYPAITDITVPGWATADSSGGSWANPGNILGPPDGSYAVWTVP